LLDRVLGREPGERDPGTIDPAALRITGEDVLGSFRY
jgi:hypothetical protein